jgi:hypothetical protein
MHQSHFAFHYEDKKAEALSYLITIGAKAIFVSECNQSPELSVKGFNEEAEIMRIMENDLNIQNFLARISNPPGINVCKRGRNGVWRCINIRLVQLSRDCNALVWKSAWLNNKVFNLSRLKITPLKENAQQSFGSFSFLRPSYNSNSCDGNIAFIRLINSSRYVDIYFQSSVDYNIFLASMKRFVDDNQ